MKRYNYDSVYSAANVVKAKKFKYTVWVALLFDTEDRKELITALPATECLTSEDYTNYKKSIKLRSRRYPEPYNKTSITNNHTRFLTYIPLFSTMKGWKWNREQILSCLDKYPDVTVAILKHYLGNGHSQIYLRQIFGKHFKCFLREISSYTTKVAGIGFRNADSTPKRVSRCDAKVNTAYALSSYRKF